MKKFHFHENLEPLEWAWKKENVNEKCCLVLESAIYVPIHKDKDMKQAQLGVPHSKIQFIFSFQVHLNISEFSKPNIFIVESVSTIKTKMFAIELQILKFCRTLTFYEWKYQDLNNFGDLVWAIIPRCYFPGYTRCISAERQNISWPEICMRNKFLEISISFATKTIFWPNFFLTKILWEPYLICQTGWP